MRIFLAWMGSAAAALAPARAIAQSQVAPWDSAPAVRRTALAPVRTERYARTPDPAETHHFQMPTARPMHLGDTMITAAGALGWLGVRHAFTRRFDAGIGLPFYVAGVSLDARYAIVLEDHYAFSAWVYGSVPVLPGHGANPSDFLGFTWQGAGPMWAAGPLVSLWGRLVGVHLGAAAVQRSLLGGVWAMGHATFDARVTDTASVIVQTVVLAEVVDESAPGRGRELIGAVHPRIFPYAIAGVRLHARRFAIDVGLLAAFAPDAPLGSPGVGIWPWTGLAQVF